MLKHSLGEVNGNEVVYLFEVKFCSKSMLGRRFVKAKEGIVRHIYRMYKDEVKNLKARYYGVIIICP